MRRAHWLIGGFILVLCSCASSGEVIKRVEKPFKSSDQAEDEVCESVIQQIDEEVGRLSRHDQSVILGLQEALSRADSEELMRIVNEMRSEGSKWQVQDEQHWALWYKIVEVASAYSYYRKPMQRGFWFMLYSRSFFDEDEACVADVNTLFGALRDRDGYRHIYTRAVGKCLKSNQARVELFNRAQVYLQKFGKKYHCTS